MEKLGDLVCKMCTYARASPPPPIDTYYVHVPYFVVTSHGLWPNGNRSLEKPLNHLKCTFS